MSPWTTPVCWGRVATLAFGVVALTFSVWAGATRHSSSQSRVEQTYSKDNGYFYRMTAKFTVKETGEAVDFDYVVACNIRLTRWRDGGLSNDSSYSPRMMVKATAGGQAAMLKTLGACHGLTSEDGDVPSDVPPLAIWFDSVDDLSNGLGYVSEDGYDNPLGKLTFRGARIDPATGADWEAWRKKSADEIAAAINWPVTGDGYTHQDGVTLISNLFGKAYAADQLSGEQYPAAKAKKRMQLFDKRKMRSFDRFLLIEQLEPPRNVSATNWTSLYCSSWDDGCTHCERKSAAVRPTCASISAHAEGTTCVPKAIACTEGKQRPGWKHCATEMIARPLIDAEQNVVGYRLGYCNAGRCERERDRYFANPEHEKIIEAYKALSKGIWSQIDRTSLYCIGSFRDLCRTPEMQGVVPCRFM
jgi:hypothetical protein